MVTLSAKRLSRRNLRKGADRKRRGPEAPPFVGDRTRSVVAPAVPGPVVVLVAGVVAVRVVAPVAVAVVVVVAVPVAVVAVVVVAVPAPAVATAVVRPVVAEVVGVVAVAA